MEVVAKIPELMYRKKILVATRKYMSIKMYYKTTWDKKKSISSDLAASFFLRKVDYVENLVISDLFKMLHYRPAESGRFSSITKLEIFLYIYLFKRDTKQKFNRNMKRGLYQDSI